MKKEKMIQTIEKLQSKYQKQLTSKQPLDSFAWFNLEYKQYRVFNVMTKYLMIGIGLFLSLSSFMESGLDGLIFFIILFYILYKIVHALNMKMKLYQEIQYFIHIKEYDMMDERLKDINIEQ